MLNRIVRELCILAAAAALSAVATAADLEPTQISGRWTGGTDDRKAGSLTLDIVACGKGWCGIKVEAGEKCGGTALKVAFVERMGPPSNSLQFDGTFELAEGTEPYVVQAWLVPPSETSAAPSDRRRHRRRISRVPPLI